MDYNDLLNEAKAIKKKMKKIKLKRELLEEIYEELKTEEINSILETNPFIIIKVEDVGGITNKIALYRKSAENEIDEFGQKVLYDYDRAYAILNDNKELITIQYYIFDPLFKEIDYFR